MKTTNKGVKANRVRRNFITQGTLQVDVLKIEQVILKSTNEFVLLLVS